MPFFTINTKLKIHYLDINPECKRVIVLLHGLGANGESWGLQIPTLAQAGFRVLAPDVRGFGQSSYPGGGLQITDLARDIANLLVNCQVSRADVVGISMGGTIALQMALDFPGHINHLVLVNTFASLRPHKMSIWLYFMIRGILVHTLGLPIQARTVARHIFPDPEQEAYRNVLIGQILQADPHGYRAALRALARFNVLSRLPEIHLPTLVITGEVDSTVPLKNQLPLVNNIIGARQEIIPQAGHAVIVEKPVEFNRILLDFLNS
jgi:3-oxoadipate enol-lactonase